MDLSEAENVNLIFDHTRGSSSVLNVGVAQGWYKVFATAGYTGNPGTTNWVELPGFNQNVENAWQYISSGNLLIPEAVKSAQTRFAFRYISSNNQSATWEIKNVKVTGVVEPAGSNNGIVKITNWNTEWLGCSLNGPWNETLQMNNVVSAMQSMNSDIYCLQELSNNEANPTVQTIVNQLGSTEWAGAIVPGETEDCDQRQAIIYRKSKVQLVSSFNLSNGNASQGNTYYYNWSAGRFPTVYNVNLVSGNASVPMVIVNIHAKAEDGDPMSYTRRLGASEALKTILDGPNYNTKNVVLIGDFNDYLIGTNSATCNCSASPYDNFVSDVNYNGITENIIDVNTNWGVRPLIENIVISNELFGNFVANSAVQETALAQGIGNFYNTTSNHLPVSARFEFSVLANADFSSDNTSLSIYPNPAKNQLKFNASGIAADASADVFDLTGRRMPCKQNGAMIDVSALPSGMYLLKVGNRTAKFIKQ